MTAALIAQRTTHPLRAAHSARATLVAVRRATREAAPRPVTVWWARLAEHGAASREHSLVAVNSTRFPDGTPVDLTTLESRGRRPAGWLVDLRYRACDGTPVGVAFGDAVAGTCPPLWFAEVSHASSPVPATSLLAFRGDAFAPGTLVAPHQVAAAGLPMADRVGEVRWWTRSGIVDAVTVDPGLRRRGVARSLVTLGEALRLLRGWAPLRSDGRLTDAGADWLDAAPVHWSPRLAPRCEVLPEEADGDALTGVARLLKGF
ncbi:hypothetical protein [Geodermatophilus marinus]|uniref:hypothetical protein n=1 Tax=Geodermatophilus sp. LHW52908 TaxID=2303986 RepID=UPI000E3EE453|nr:hypothetical protein [Geodermatophilus sp. LHW52908]RFU22314.1 hypothetical protein D0Z06_06585 [Geodermatophilus sp. LHW52908]